jgi:WD40 repeat protein
VTPDGRRAVTGCANKRVWVWDLESGELVAALVPHSHFRAMIAGHGFAESVAVTPDGRRAISPGGLDNTVWVWDIESEAVLHELEGHHGQVMRVSVTPDGRRVVSGSADGTLRLWDLERGSCLATFDAHQGAIASLCLTPDGTRAVSGSADHTVRVWDLESGACLAVMSAAAPVVAAAATSRHVVAGTQSGAVWFQDLETR